MSFLEATAGMTDETKGLVVRKMLATAGVVALLLLALGGLLTRLLHFSTGALSIASGIVLLIIAVGMVLSRHDQKTTRLRSRERIRWRSPFFRWWCRIS